MSDAVPPTTPPTPTSGAVPPSTLAEIETIVNDVASGLGTLAGVAFPGSGSLISLGMTLLKGFETIVLPEVQRLFASGMITVQQQADMLAAYNSLKNAADGQFSGPEWQVD